MIVTPLTHNLKWHFHFHPLLWRLSEGDGDNKERPLKLLLVCFHTEHTLCIIKGRLNQAINTHSSSFAGLCRHGNMCVFLSQPDTAGDCDGCEIWRREQSRIKTAHYFLCVPPRAPERTGGGKSLALLILALILTANDSLFSNPSVLVVMMEPCWCCRHHLLPHRAVSMHGLVCVWRSTSKTFRNPSHNSTLTDSLTRWLSSHTPQHTWTRMISDHHKKEESPNRKGVTLIVVLCKNKCAVRLRAGLMVPLGAVRTCNKRTSSAEIPGAPADSHHAPHTPFMGTATI